MGVVTAPAPACDVTNRSRERRRDTQKYRRPLQSFYKSAFKFMAISVRYFDDCLYCFTHFSLTGSIPKLITGVGF
ncbi:hypothetical protein E2C01_045959 [Portunus trituberculatus]|uniref:Uncharacterized protein n=1 Tax=Portunus trituberculatus TaxID=210409 RepID=A0A5B7G3H9_PORTR|nr:hypothetical protein [Portunus trituberculatus]